jgi:putative nucleotidyltransferase with HDIG domain
MPALSASPPTPADIESLLAEVRAALNRRAVEAYVVGGTVRDWLLGRDCLDIDLAVRGDGHGLAVEVADELGGRFVSLDEPLGMGRIVWPARGYLTVDLASLRGPDIESDLTQRDFTVNAMAVALEGARPAPPADLIDPHAGRLDLEAGILRAVGPHVFEADPVRLVRAVRIAHELGARIEPMTAQLVREAVRLATAPAAERLRDEIIRLFRCPNTTRAIRLMDRLGLLEQLLPELTRCRGVEQPPPHGLDVYDHLLATLDATEEVLAAVRVTDGQRPPHSGLASVLGPSEHELRQRMQERLVGGSLRWMMLKFGALLHDVGKPDTRAFDEERQRHRFIGHEVTGARLATDVMRRLRFGGQERDYVRSLVREHLRPLQLSKAGLTRRAVYRFYRALGHTGVDVCLLSLADNNAKSGDDVDQARQELWPAVAELLHKFYQERDQTLPRPLLSGHEVLDELDIEPGPEVGRLLELLREAQATGVVRDRGQALEALRRWHS